MNSILESQFHAGLEMLRRAVAKCPDELWNDSSFDNRFWQIAYHALFYTHLYLSPSEEEFVPWSRGISNAQFFGAYPWPPHDTPVIEGVLDPQDILDYANEIEANLPSAIESVPFESDAGFSWIPFSRLELHVYNIRHLQHHVGQLVERLRATGAGGSDWVGRKR